MQSASLFAETLPEKVENYNNIYNQKKQAAFCQKHFNKGKVYEVKLDCPVYREYTNSIRFSCSRKPAMRLDEKIKTKSKLKARRIGKKQIFTGSFRITKLSMGSIFKVEFLSVKTSK